MKEITAKDCRDAAETIKAKDARIAELEAQLEQHHRVVDAAEQHCKRADELGDEVDRLTAQLARARELYGYSYTCYDRAHGHYGRNDEVDVFMYYYDAELAKVVSDD